MKNSLNAVAELVLKASFDDVCIVCHKNPDGDTIGSAFALHHALKSLGKKCFVFCSDPFPAKFDFITRENDESFVPENVITVDVASPSLLGEFEYGDKISVAIDHHAISTVSASVRFCDPSSASCSEIILSLIKLLSVELNEYMANALYVGISTDTGCLRYSNTNKNTYLAVASLTDCVGDGGFHKLNKIFFETKTRMQLSLEAFATNNVMLEPDEKTAILVFTLSDKARLGARDDELDCLINAIRLISGVTLSIVMKEKDENVFRLSVRSEDDINASELCSRFDGGGHRAAAGCTIHGSADEVKERIIKEILLLRKDV